MIETIGKISGLILPFLLVIIAIISSRRKKEITKVSIVICVVIVLIIFIMVGIHTYKYNWVYNLLRDLKMIIRIKKGGVYSHFF